MQNKFSQAAFEPVTQLSYSRCRWRLRQNTMGQLGPRLPQRRQYQALVLPLHQHLRGAEEISVASHKETDEPPKDRLRVALLFHLHLEEVWSQLALEVRNLLVLRVLERFDWVGRGMLIHRVLLKQVNRYFFILRKQS